MFYIKIYTCVCGRTFDKPNSFNAHKSHCKIHFESKGKPDGYEKRLKHQRVASAKGNQVKQQEAEQHKQEWLSEKHCCETCGKVMTEYYGSGRFCSQSCANSREHTEETRQKISDTLQNGESPSRNHRKAVEHFKNTGEWFEGCVLHHIDESLRHTDVERYNEWRPEDLVVMSKGEHLRHHYYRGDVRPKNQQGRDYNKK